MDSSPMRRDEELLLNCAPERPHDCVLLAPFSGPMVPLADVPDPVFADGMFGDGIGIDPLEGVLLAPCDGVITHLARTHHAVTLRTSQGAEILVHIGIDTVELAGKGFTPKVEQGASVRAGQVLIEFDADYVAQHAPSLVSVIAVGNSDAFEIIDRADRGVLTAGASQLLVLRCKGGVKADAARTDANFTDEARPDLTLAPTSGFHA